MKTLRFIVMAMFAVALSMSFTACSSSDDDDNGGVGNQDGNSNFTQKYITVQKSKSVSGFNEAGERIFSENIFNVSYDDVLLTRIDCSNSSNYWVFDYGKLQIENNHLITEAGSNYTHYSTTSYDFTIGDNACITKIKDHGYRTPYKIQSSIQLKYNENRQLVSSVYKQDEKASGTTTNYTWENGNLVKVEELDESEQIYTYFEYGNTPNKGNIMPHDYSINIGMNNTWPFNDVVEDVFNIVMSSGLFGVLSKNLPTKVTQIHKGKYEYGDYKGEYEYEETVNYTYELDEQGFVKSVSAKGDWSDDYTRPLVYSSSFTYKN